MQTICIVLKEIGAAQCFASDRTTRKSLDLKLTLRIDPQHTWTAENNKGAIGSLQPFLGSLGAGIGEPGSHHAMQKPTWVFCLVANIASREPKGPV
jgi:hypothetical protein